jgi:hypothetical protein
LTTLDLIRDEQQRLVHALATLDGEGDIMPTATLEGPEGRGVMLMPALGNDMAQHFEIVLPAMAVIHEARFVTLAFQAEYRTDPSDGEVEGEAVILYAADHEATSMYVLEVERDGGGVRPVGEWVKQTDHGNALDALREALGAVGFTQPG